MEIFTYRQYIKSIHTFRLHAVMQLAEESEKYQLKKEEKENFQNSLVENILQDEKEARQLINQFIEPREEIKEELVPYNNWNKMKKEEIDFIYQLKTKNTFFVIIHQSRIEEKTPYRILNRCFGIMREWMRDQKKGRNKPYPIIVPIVIYTGNQKGKTRKKFYIDERLKIELEYNLIDINKISKQSLLEKESILAYTMFLEKARTYEEFIKNIQNIIKIEKDKEKLKKLSSQIHWLLDNILEEKERKVGEKTMSTLIERLKNAKNSYIRQGKEENQREITKNMIHQEFDENMILKLTKIPKTELEKIKKECLV